MATPNEPHGLALAVVTALLFTATLLHSPSTLAREESPARYLAFQIFTMTWDSKEGEKSFPPPPENLLQTVQDLQSRIGAARPGPGPNRPGFIIGPLSFDHTDEEIRALIENAFDIALKTGMAVGFHIDDSMFWGRLSSLNTPDSVEWLDWNGTPNTGRRLDWSMTPLKIKPQLCLNSPEVRKAVADRATLIGNAVAAGVKRLEKEAKTDLFIGIIAGWETMLGKDFDTGRPLGYCALTNKGFSAKNPPPDFDRARTEIVRDFIGFWAQSLRKAGVPKDSIYSHIAFQSEAAYNVSRRAKPEMFTETYLQTINLTPPNVAFSGDAKPGFSTYPQPGQLEQIYEALSKHDNPPWASSEGTAIDPGIAEQGGDGMNMERYLGNLFNHGARLVTIFGWGVGESDNPFRKITESESSIAAYKKFLRGGRLEEAAIPIPQIPPADLPEKIHKIQAALPMFVKAHGPQQVEPLMKRLESHIQKQQFNDAAKLADEILSLIKQ